MYRDEAARQALHETLASIHHSLEHEAHQAHPDQARATGTVHGLLSILAAEVLTHAEQQEVEQILALHRQCLYGCS